ncbi:MAG: S8 family serine peptidase [Bdellovibrionales bacterium]|nr:S8 family serine peptidase [Bdellovibrionales bacterium]
MKKLLAVASLFALAATAQDAPVKRYIVRFHSPSLAQGLKEQLQLSRKGLLSPEKLGRDLFRTEAHVSAALTNLQMAIVESAASVDQLRQNPQIASVEEDVILRVPSVPKAHSVNNLAGAAPIAPPTLSDRGESTWGLQAIHAESAQNLVPSSARGARVLILDTGIDRTHSDLQGLIENGRDFSKVAAHTPNLAPIMSIPLSLFAADAADAIENYDDVYGHGTHVAGTIAAQANGSGVLGVAPMVKLLVGRVCNADGTCAESSVIKGLDWAIDQHADVVNMSLGMDNPLDVEREAVKRVTDANIVVVAASGNGCPPSQCPAGISYPAAYPSAIAVGAVDANFNRGWFSQYGPELAIMAPGVGVRSSLPRKFGIALQVLVKDASGSREIPSLIGMGSQTKGNATVSELAYVAPNQALNSGALADKIALLERTPGQLDYTTDLERARKAGAKASIIMNDQDGLLSLYTAEGGIDPESNEPHVDAGVISHADGADLKARLAQGEKVQLSVQVVESTETPWQGTSMATPHVTGVVALMKTVNPSLSVDQIRDILKKTATPLNAHMANEMGAGLVNAEAAVQAALAAIH